MDSTVIELLKLTAVGLISGFFASFMSNRDHRYRKWWELRVTAYQGVIEALSDTAHSFDTFMDAEIRGNEVPEEKDAELRKLLQDGYSRIRRAADTGAFLFSDNVAKALAEYKKSRDVDHQSYFEHLDHGYAEVQKCLRILVENSKKDLELKSSWHSPL